MQQNNLFTCLENHVFIFLPLTFIFFISFFLIFSIFQFLFPIFFCCFFIKLAQTHLKTPVSADYPF